MSRTSRTGRLPARGVWPRLLAWLLPVSPQRQRGVGRVGSLAAAGFPITAGGCSMNAKRRLTIGANTEIEVADRLKKGGTSECPLHHQTTTYEPIQTFAN